MKALPAGAYYIGDCCYVLQDNPETPWMEFCNQFFDDEENITMLGHSIVAYSTVYGDGTYPSNIGYEFPVDAGLIGCTPAALWKGEGQPFGCRLITFKNDFVCNKIGNTLDFGGIIIDTDPDEEDEDENY